jgi:hypothetical protein
LLKVGKGDGLTSRAVKRVVSKNNFLRRGVGDAETSRR